MTALDLYLRPDEQCIALAGNYRLIQPRRGHRYSVDDMIVAHLACQRCATPRRVLDLGCGLGSVLLITAWAKPDAELVGVEAQPEHVFMARRNVALNDEEARVRVVAGDLRDQSLIDELGRFELVTGTPPYFDPRRATVCADPQRAAAHFELRGGIEAYASAASCALAPEGLFVACAAAEPAERVRDAVDAAGLSLLSWQPVVPRRGQPPFLVLIVCRVGGASTPFVREPELVLRESDGRRSAEHVAIRDWTAVTSR